MSRVLKIAGSEKWGRAFSLLFPFRRVSESVLILTILVTTPVRIGRKNKSLMSSFQFPGRNRRTSTTDGTEVVSKKTDKSVCWHWGVLVWVNANGSVLLSQLIGTVSDTDIESSYLRVTSVNYFYVPLFFQ